MGRGGKGCHLGSFRDEGDRRRNHRTLPEASGQLQKAQISRFRQRVAQEPLRQNMEKKAQGALLARSGTDDFVEGNLSSGFVITSLCSPLSLRGEEGVEITVTKPVLDNER